MTRALRARSRLKLDTFRLYSTFEICGKHWRWLAGLKAGAYMGPPEPRC